jgi:hypothetical protein
LLVQIHDSVIVKLLDLPRLRSLNASYCSDLLGIGFSIPFLAANTTSLAFLDLCDPRKGGGGFQRMSRSQLGFGGGSALRAFHRPAVAIRSRSETAAKSFDSASVLGNNGVDLEALRDAVDAMQGFKSPGLRFVSFRGCNRSTRNHFQNW